MAFASNLNGSAHRDSPRTRSLQRMTMHRFWGLVETEPATQPQCEVELMIDPTREPERGLAHMDHVDMMAELAASLAHEITEPIAAAELGAEACLRWIDRDPPALEEVPQVLLRIIKDAKRAATIVERNCSHYRKGVARAPIERVAMLDLASPDR
jgi:signal transduction histidine kinase